MAHIQRLYDFQPGTKIMSDQVDAEFNQLINYVNRLDDANSALASTTGATKVGVSEGGNLQTLLDKLVRFATADIKYIRLNEDKVIETSANGVDWEASGSPGHVIQRANGTILPQRSQLQFLNTTIIDDAANDRTVVQGVVGPKGDKGEQGIPGPGLEFDWNGTQLGVRVEGQSSYQYVNLKGDKGDIGPAPDIIVGSVTTLPPGSNATVNRRSGSPDTAPIFDFGIPKGLDGKDGKDGKDAVLPFDIWVGTLAEYNALPYEQRNNPNFVHCIYEE